ncbi:MAG: hypothetical protein H6740_27950 [Alphaproteobacteria bacterium]|nr:hypothetical protein [Alphaproteobacteria bacterium]
MDLLPPPQERPWLLEQLADLLERVGRERFLSGPLLEPGDKALPEPEDLDSLETTLGTLSAHAGLGELERFIDAYEDASDIEAGSPTGESMSWRHGDSPLWFVGASEGRVLMFGLLMDELRRARGVLPQLCHELTHAWRDHHGLSVNDEDLEELLTDLSAVYLGLGLFACQGGPVTEGKVVVLGAARRRRSAALKPQAMAYLLGAQLVLRDLGNRERARLLRHLPAERREMVKAAIADLSRPGRLEELSPQDPAAMGQVVRLPVPARTVRKVESNQLLVGLGKGLVLGAILGFFSLRILGPLSAIVLFVVGGVVGANLGRSTRSLYCSGCGGELHDSDAVCPSCDALVRDR